MHAPAAQTRGFAHAFESDVFSVCYTRHLSVVADRAAVRHVLALGIALARKRIARARFGVISQAVQRGAVAVVLGSNLV